VDISNSSYQNQSKKTTHETVIRNLDKFGPLAEDSIVIVVQVHKRANYLRHLIGSLSVAKNISNALLVFSHDYIDDHINVMIEQIDFCKVTQIFYPYSIQKFPNVYPGIDPNDCDRDLKKNEAMARNCNNALYPDIYGHYREATHVQTKLHWWWKMNHVFNHMEYLKDYEDLILFVEEDNFLSEDFIHVLKQMKQVANKSCPNCNIFSLGSVKPGVDITTDNANKLETSVWLSPKHNHGMAFNRTIWHQIKSCSAMFCSIDELNWDWSLQALSKMCIKNKLNVLQIQGPRIFHLGICGLHFKAEKCDDTTELLTRKMKLEDMRDWLFPKTLLPPGKPTQRFYPPFRRNGGFSDLRDVILCMQMSL
jgi:alpha-1,6-mannosyl-glycoprotein beta-1,2-N-acetylglucosaminyltransferase